jgi:hypothetical protein
MTVALGLAYPTAVAHGQSANPPQPTALFFLGTDGWAHGVFGYGGFLWSPGGLDNAGFTLKALGAGGSYNYISGDLGGIEVKGRQFLVAVQPGWRFKQDTWVLTLFAGPEFHDNRLTPDDPGNTSRGSHLGVSGGADLWYQPVPEWMVSLNGSLNDQKTFSARAAFGRLVFDQFFVGPEAQTFGGDSYWQYRFGLQATGVKTGPLEWSIGAGWAEDSDSRGSLYGYLGVLTRR